MLKSTNKDKGFTIIEVVLVLAIAGLIFLVVFLALPALQRSQRDTARRQDVGRIIARLQVYQVDNSYNLPASSWYYSSFFTGVTQVTDIWMRPGGDCGSVNSGAYINWFKVGWGVIQQGCTCSQSLNNTGIGDSTSRHASVQTRLENGSAYCEEF